MPVSYTHLAGKIDGYLYPVVLSDQTDPAAIDLLWSDNAAGVTAAGSAAFMPGSAKFPVSEAVLPAYTEGKKLVSREPL